MAKAREPLPTITTTELSRKPADVVRRVMRGERLIISRRNRAIATLQPLDGYVFQPFAGTAHDIFGWPIGGVEDEIAKLSEPQRQLLLRGVRTWRVWPTRLWDQFDGPVVLKALEEMRLLGLVIKTERGNELTGRGLARREALLRMEGREPEGREG